MSANLAYGQVTLGPTQRDGGEYEDPDKLAARSKLAQVNYEQVGHPDPCEFSVSKPDAPVYATAAETTDISEKTSTGN